MEHPDLVPKAERFIQTALRDWSYARACNTSKERVAELPNSSPLQLEPAAWQYRLDANYQQTRSNRKTYRVSTAIKLFRTRTGSGPHVVRSQLDVTPLTAS